MLGPGATKVGQVALLASALDGTLPAGGAGRQVFGAGVSTTSQLSPDHQRLREHVEAGRQPQCVHPALGSRLLRHGPRAPPAHSQSPQPPPRCDLPPPVPRHERTPPVNQRRARFAPPEGSGSPSCTEKRTPAERANRPSRCREGVLSVRQPSGPVPSWTATRTPLGSEADDAANSLLPRLTGG